MKKIIVIISAIVLIVSSVLIYVLVLPVGDGDGFTGLLLDTHESIAAQRTFDRNDTAGALGSASPIIAPLSISDIISERTPRDGYTLAPTMFGLTGIDTASSFILRTPPGYSASAPSIYIDGQPQPEITREDENTFIITPAIPLTSNSIYIFRLARSGADVTWAFQTSARFELTSTLPRNQSTNVPVRTGIEIAFSLGDELDITEHFSIYPHAAGEFIHRGSTVIFTPSSPLMHGQIYTVTISAGISLPGTSEVIGANHIFSFETAPSPAQSTSRGWDSSIHFFSQHVEFPSFTPPSVNFWFSFDMNRARPAINMNVYRIDDRTQAIDAVNRLTNVPNWSQIQQADRFVDTSGLTRVHSSRFHGNREDEWRWNETFTLPDNLSPGFYVLNAVPEDSGNQQNNNQVIIQITDLAVQVIADDDKALVWVNDMTTGLPAAGATVHDPINSKIYETSEYGVAVIERMLSVGEYPEYLIVTAADGKESVVFVHSGGIQPFHRGGWWDWNSTASNNYWTALQLDRTLFQRSDTLSLWGFVQNRRQQENITHVTAVLTEHAWWNSAERDTLHRQNFPVAGGAYSGEIRLPHLDPGSYELAVYHGDVLLSSIFFSVMDYVKPPYQLTVSADKSAIFAGEEVTFTARTEFFEGTPVPDLDISYNFWGWQLRTPSGGQRQTNLDGVIELTARPTAEQGTNDNSVQGERSLQFTAEATLPEIGWVHEWANVRVFVNDIDVRPQATRTGRNANLSVDVHNITLDRINDGTAEHWGDYLCTPATGQRITVEIVEIWWERIQTGQRYDHVTRQVIPWYRHERRERSLERFEIVTDADGNAARDFQVPNTEKRSYAARLTTTDGNGRTITHSVFIGRDFTNFFNIAGNEFPFLYGVNPEGYDIGDNVELTIMRGAEPVTQGNFLFVVVQDGILSYHIGVNPLTFTFGEQHVPNTQVFAYHFNGHTYHTSGMMSQRLRYNTANRNLNIAISVCQEAYRPGDTATFNITATDPDGNPKAANINISLVDEALFALMDYTVDTLEMLYRNVNDSLRISMATHGIFVSDGIEIAEEEAQMFGMAADMAMEGGPALAAAPMTDQMESARGGNDTRIRERFEDTAVFASLRTNAQGEAAFTFQLPDNITSWRMTASAISDDLYAGNNIQNVRVTQPMFLHYTLNSVFLVGDIPYIGVNVYGTSLSGGEQAAFEVWREDAPSDIRRATGRAFERVNIPLWEMTAEGFGAIIVRATVNGYSDAVSHSYQVLSSHRLVDTAVFYEVTPATIFNVNPGGLTNITFTDHGRGQFLSDLFSLRHIWRSGARIEGLVARREATRLIQTHFPDVQLFGDAGNFDVLEYQTESGGIAILPYADADLQTTVMLMPFILDEVNLAALRSYLRNIYNTSSADNKMLALYGLAMLGEPVLLDLQSYAMLTDLSVRDAAYIALGFAAMGEFNVARDLYNSRIAPHIQNIAPYYRVNAGSNRAEILDATSVAALLAAQLEMPESLGLHNYTVRHRFDAPHRFNDDALLLNVERLTFIYHEITTYTDAAASITYTLFGETVTRDLGHGGSFTLRIPAQNMHEFNLISTTGEVGAVSIIRIPLEDMETVENDIVIRREFFRAGTNTSANTFEQGELVRVQITVDYSARDISGSYIITDFLPAGLVHVANSARFGNRTGSSPAGWWAHARTEGQRITFFDFNGRFNRVHTYYYYARVINPGTFKAEGTLVQSLGAREYLAVGEDAVLTINP